MDDFLHVLNASAAKIEARLSELLNRHLSTGHARLNEAMRYSVLGAGKRIRPFLVLQIAALFKADEAAALDVAAGLECLHCYSLIHDDLPSMDDDDLRRGRPSLHRAFDEATAILAGDALLTLAFECVASAATLPEIGLLLVRELAQAAGAAGMVSGQMRDLEAEGRFADGAPLKLSSHDIDALQAQKTGALIRYACRAGALLGQASKPQLEALTTYGETLGILFQLADDLLDVTGTEMTAGKAVAKDAARGKATRVSLMGVKAAQDYLKQLSDKSKVQLADFKNAEILMALPDYLTEHVLPS